MKIKVAIVEDDQIIRDGLEYILKNSKGFDCIGVFVTAEEALNNLDVENVDVVLMDINLPGMNGIECARILKQKRENIDIMMLTIHEEPDKIFQSLMAGATGYILKNTSMKEILRSIKELKQGGSPMSSQIARKVIQAFQIAPVEKTNNLSEREYEIVCELANGLTYDEIAEKLFISVETVRYHIKNIYSKLQVHSRTEAVMKVFQSWRNK
ncbi:MAG: two component transcriptional regulator, LuxR family [Ignavibacteriae bacterium]|nr:MAG: two component transcriptional regulator, LuxR family [Ignavibacteriota bacterium]